MRRNLAGQITINSRLLAASLLLTLGVGGCKFFKKGDSGPDAQASAVVSAAPLPSVAEMPSIAPVPSATLPVVHAVHHTSTSTATTTSESVATATSATPAAASAASPQPPAAPSIPAIGALNPQCQAACQKGYQDCIAQSGGLSGMDLIKKCREALKPCIAACK